MPAARPPGGPGKRARSAGRQKQIGFVFCPGTTRTASSAPRQTEFDRLVAQAMPLSDFPRELAQRCDLTSSEGKAPDLRSQALLSPAADAAALRLQLVKRPAAEASGFSRPRSNACANVKSYAPAPPPRPAKRPSLTRNLLRIVLQQPHWRARLPIDLLPDTPERPALTCLHQLVWPAPRWRYARAALREQPRGQPEEGVIENAASGFGLPFDKAGADSEFRDDTWKNSRRVAKTRLRRTAIESPAIRPVSPA